jgi:general secretion pathway protein M
MSNPLPTDPDAPDSADVPEALPDAKVDSLPGPGEPDGRGEPSVVVAAPPGSPAAAPNLGLEPADDAADAPRRGQDSDWGCVAAWGAALLIPALLIALVALPLLDRIGVLDEDYERGLDQLQRYQRLVATLPRLRTELEQAQANDDFKAFYFDAETPGLAGATLQSEVQEMVRAAGGRPISTQILPVDESEQPARVRIRTQLQGTTDELLDVLYRIEAARPFLFVDQMSIRSTAPRRRNVRSRRASRPARQQNVGQLTVRLDVFGYVLGSGG